MSDMVPTGSKYTDEDRQQAAVQYAVTGSLTKTEQATGIPDSTIGEWTKTEWWDDILGKVRAEKGDEHRAQYSAIVDQAQAKALELIPDMKDAKAAVLMACMSTDKIRLADNMPTSISGKSDGMEQLAATFRKLSAQHKQRMDSVVSVQHTTSSGSTDTD